MAFHDFEHQNMVPGKAAPSSGAVLIIYNTEDGILEARGKTVPPDATSGYAPSCIFHHVDGSNNTVLYVNVGTKASANFDQLSAVVNGQAHITDPAACAAMTATLTGVDTGTDMTAAQAATIVADLAALKTAVDANNAVIDSIIDALEASGITLTS